MKKLLGIVVLGSLLFLQTSNVNAHEDLKIGHNKHPERICKPPEKRNWFQKRNCADLKKKHSLCKQDVYCALERLKELEKIIKDLEKKITDQDPVRCTSLNFNHVALKDGKVYQATSTNSKVIKKIKKGQEISYIGTTNEKGWIIIVPHDKICTVGYIDESYIGQAGEDPPPPPADYAINITHPKWKKKRELIVLNQSGWFELDGFVDKDLGINKVTLNYEGDDEEMIIGNDGSINASLLIDDDLDVRIVAYKNNEQVGKTLKFKIQVGN